ncbi:MAG: polyhydroxyalkanoate synthase [Parasphingorhabdus sp.]|jgi:polyhydroxyalkanoate synthase
MNSPKHTASENILLEISRNLSNAHGFVKQLPGNFNGATASECVASISSAKLYYYPGKSEHQCKTPLLIIYALVNRPYMLDLEPGRSFIANLLEEGLPVYLLDWGYPDVTDQFLSLHDYIFDFIDEAVDQVTTHSGKQSINLLGVCQGGTLSLCYSAARKEKVRTLITTVTPVDFHTPDNLLTAWFKDVDVKSLASACGNVPGNFLNWVFVSLKPFTLGAGKYVDMLSHAQDQEKLSTFLNMERWILDSPDQAGNAFCEFVSEFYQKNALVKGQLNIGGESIQLSNIDQPVLNIYALQDHLVPRSASTVLGGLVHSADYSEEAIDAGHIGLFTSRKKCAEVAKTIGTWLKERD